MNQWLMIHVMKTAGTSLRYYLEHTVPGSVFPKQHELVSESYGERYLFADEFLGRAARDSRLFLERRFFFGHFHFELVDRLPESFRTAVFLRDPVGRALSMINHKRRVSAKEYGRSSVSDMLENSSFMASQIRDYQAKVFAIRDGSVSPNDPYPMNEARFQYALENLKRCDFIGIMENMRASLCLFEKMAGVEFRGRIPRMNVSYQPVPIRLMKAAFRRTFRPPRFDSRAALSAVELRGIEEAVQYDTRLYSEAVRLNQDNLRAHGLTH